MRLVHRMAALLTMLSATVLLLDIGAWLFGLSFLRSPVTGGGSSLQTNLMIAPLLLALVRFPLLKRDLTSFTLALGVLLYVVAESVFAFSIDVELYLAEFTSTYGLWTSESTFLIVGQIAISILLLPSRFQLFGATLAFVATITPLHLVLTYFVAPEYLKHHIPLSTSMVLVMFSGAVLLRYASRALFRKFFADKKHFVQLLMIGFIGVILQQSLVLFDLYRHIYTEDLDLLVVSLPLQYLLFRFAISQVDFTRTIVKYGRRMHRYATRDALTGCANRQSLKEALASFATGKHSRIGVLLFDIDHFKQVNDKYGHDEGDEVLKKLSSQVRSVLRGRHHFVRWGGEEFVVISQIQSSDELIALAEQLREAVEQAKFGSVGRITISLGAALGELDRFYQLVSDADVALYYSKSEGRNRTTLADAEFMQRMANAGEAVSFDDVRTALLDHKLFFVGQPIMDVKDDRVVAIEALLRWRFHNDEVLVPTQFIDKLNQIVLADSALYEVLTLAKLRFIESLSRTYPDAGIAFNVTVEELYKPECNASISQLIDAARSAGRGLIFELSEGAVSQGGDLSVLNKIIVGYRDAGVRIAIDDFGSGSNNLRNLMRLDVDIVKLAPSIANSIDSGSKTLRVLSSLNLMMHNLKVEIYIEGIDTELQSRLLKGLGYRYQQGYYIGAPDWVYDSSVSKVAEHDIN